MESKQKKTIGIDFPLHTDWRGRFDSGKRRERDACHKNVALRAIREEQKSKVNGEGGLEMQNLDEKWAIEFYNRTSLSTVVFHQFEYTVRS